MKHSRNDKGFTLVEMVVAMAIFLFVILAANQAFQSVVASSTQQTKSLASNIDGIVGLELLRYDVEHAGYGLPWRFQSYTGAISFRNLGGSANVEAEVANEALAKGMDSASLNAVQSANIKAIDAGTCGKEVNGSDATNVGGGPDYLVLRSVLAPLNRGAGDASRKWSYLNYSSSGGSNHSYLRKWNNAEDLGANDRATAILSTFTSSGSEEKVLLMNGLDFEVRVGTNGALPAGDPFKPNDRSEVVVAYGIANSANAGSALRMPYHRTDYYLFRPAVMPQTCNPGTGILYKAVVDQATGRFGTQYPLLNCVADLQVEFEYDAKDDGNISYLSGATLASLRAAEIRDHLKIVRVYLLVQEGKRDDSFNYPGDSIQVGDRARPTTSGRTLSAADMASLFTADWRKYRWKLYTIVTRPKNLVQ
ncbi:PilW family protein [Geomonas anaerohicana]|uniref:PilW family protein n=1 Tax=Geomonas anaerohicana TaxID=2798583 RepID=UPI002E2B9E80|nr:prepilin-type N-terminal cleavage/methylation domain-containing protein [Geomonas anaerohicana]